MDRDLGIKIGDFSDSYYLFKEGIAGKAQTAVGDAFWLAPEIAMQKAYASQADVWSFGITCIEMVTGKAPFGDTIPVAVRRLAASQGVL